MFNFFHLLGARITKIMKTKYIPYRNKLLMRTIESDDSVKNRVETQSKHGFYFNPSSTFGIPKFRTKPPHA